MIRRVFILVLLAATAGAAGAADDATRSKITARVVSAQTTLASDQSTLTLDDVVRTALAKNPAVLSAAHSVAAQRTKVPQARALPEPTFGIGWMGNPTPLQRAGGGSIELSQRKRHADAAFSWQTQPPWADCR
ncbi:MAG: hypothetical protein ACJ72H_16815 [Candidatus Sulfotelmatobacter sp.]